MRVALLVLLFALAPLAAAESIVPIPVCTSEVPETQWDPPLCSDHEMNSALLEAGDGAAIARALLREALKSDETTVLLIAIHGFASQRDETALAAIDEALARKPDDAPWLAMGLAEFRSEAPDRLAFKYIGAERRELYFEEREQVSR